MEAISEIDFNDGSAHVDKLLIDSYEAITHYNIPKYEEIQAQYKKGLESELRIDRPHEADSDSDVE